LGGLFHEALKEFCVAARSQDLRLFLAKPAQLAEFGAPEGFQKSVKDRRLADIAKAAIKLAEEPRLFDPKWRSDWMPKIRLWLQRALAAQVVPERCAPIREIACIVEMARQVGSLELFHRESVFAHPGLVGF
jgi:hypothetical protein